MKLKEATEVKEVKKEIKEAKKSAESRKTSSVLYDLIVDKYGSVADFSSASGIPLIDLNALFLKDNVAEEICIGLLIFRILNIDVDEIVFNGRIEKAGYSKKSRKSEKIRNKRNGARSVYGRTGKNARPPTENEINEIRDRYVRLSEFEKAQILEYIEKIKNE
ncbi:MAG: hypothetical protein FWH10_07325 [Oscillospiraceae bacterium]|nr:hypothetical protein [Oscillospiraceae bacterium]